MLLISEQCNPQVFLLYLFQRFPTRPPPCPVPSPTLLSVGPPTGPWTGPSRLPSGNRTAVPVRGSLRTRSEVRFLRRNPYMKKKPKKTKEGRQAQLLLVFFFTKKPSLETESANQNPFRRAELFLLLYPPRPLPVEMMA